ncbi:hypothetical protein GGI25_002939 [Coemansia spiralis]|uniref:Kinesin motor domain-containing protein n=2 Tax=Coemansia TaxID=4863 RepID=A0A9W8G7Y7_9FUNG|nr:hypothetical protein EDC05_002397 [Coemansia umbellata]KAJ2621323.1 hypothetical protein GGI26_004200 [Coemansia sp. RSA 1358]KAJ2677694.1 hypothetical protein GGI25_002939 [Coemansia spiralis]
MNSSVLKLQNTEVVTSLVGSQSLARPGDTSKYFTYLNNGVSERVYVDGCTSDNSNIFSVGNTQSYIKHAIEGGTSAVFLSGSGISRMADYDRKPFMAQFCRSIGQCMAHFDPDLSMTYAFVGVTDNKLIDFHRDRNVSMDKLRNGLADLQHEVEDWEITEEKIMRGATLPFILSLHFESMKGAPTNGHLCLIDLNVVNWSPSGNHISNAASNALSPMDASAAVSNSKLQQSIKSLSSMIHLMANDAILTGVTIPNNSLISLVGEFLYGESKTAFVVYINTDDSASQELDTTVELIKSLRKLKSREIIRTVDRRVLFFYEKAKYYQCEKYRLQDDLADVQEEKEQLEKDLDDIQRDFSEERDALNKEVEHWQNKSKDLDATLEALKTESAGIEADARWENAKLVTEKLAMKDELRRAEIEMTAAEDAKSQLLDLYETLQTSYNSLDSVYSELLEAYRLLKEKFGLLADERAGLEQSVADLEAAAEQKSQQISNLKAEIASLANSRDRQIEKMEEEHAQQIETLEAQLGTEFQRTKELSAKLAQLETANKSLAVSQTEEVASLQATVNDLSSQLEESQRQSASEVSAISTALRASEKKIKKLEAEKTKMDEKMEELIANKEDQTEYTDREFQWQREREQLQRQIKRLQQTAHNAECREAELREESERQWSAWEAEKNRNHQKYLKLKDKFRDAVEIAADVQVKLDEERESTESSTDKTIADMPVAVDNTSSSTARKLQHRGAPQKKRAATKSVAFSESVDADSEDNDVEMVDVSHDTENVSESVTRAPTRRTTATRSRKTRPNYTEPDANDDEFGQAANNQRASAPVSSRQRRTTVAEADITDSASHDNGEASEDSEITFNETSMTPAPESPPKQRRARAAPRQRKSVAELNAELTTQPARRRAGGTARSRKQLTSDQTQSSEPAPKKPSPKRKRAADTARASKNNSNGSNGTAVLEKAPSSAFEAEMTITASRSSNTEESSNGTSTAANVLKKKRKLNLSRMRSLLGINGDKSIASTAVNPQAVKFAVPRIKPGSGAASHGTTATATAGAANDDSD